MGSTNGLGEFLRARRGQVCPESVGIRPAPGRRRVPGLRREELAQLAGVSVDYLTRLEQGRNLHPSDQVVHTLAEALRLPAADRKHLRSLAHAQDSTDCSRQLPPQHLRSGTRRLLHALPDSPAFILGSGLQILGQNPLASALLGDLQGANLLRLIFLDPRARQLLGDWEQVATTAVGVLRAQATARSGDRGVCAMNNELLRQSKDFARMWATHEVHSPASGSVSITHPRLGAFALDYETLTLPDDEQCLIIFTAEPGSTARKVLDLLLPTGTAR